MMNFLYQKHKWVCGAILVLQIFYFVFLRLLLEYDMKHDTSKGWGGLGASILMERQIPIFFFQSLLFIWSAFIKEVNKIQITMIMIGSLLLILASMGLIRVLDNVFLYLF